jgi:hypothetical protein
MAKAGSLGGSVIKSSSLNFVIRLCLELPIPFSREQEPLRIRWANGSCTCAH